MKNQGLDIAQRRDLQIAGGQPSRAVKPNYLHLVTPSELDNLLVWLARGGVPPDFDAKLKRLASSTLAQSYVEQNCRRFLALLMAAVDGSFKPITPDQWQRLLRVLAYVRKDEDAIPDYRPDGYLDDGHEVRAAATDLNTLLQNFKAWRLRQQVPRLWFPE